jgi:hypothetical protein
MRVGRPFRVVAEELAGGDRRRAKAAATERIMREIAALLPPDQRGAYGGAEGIRATAAEGAVPGS